MFTRTPDPKSTRTPGERLLDITPPVPKVKRAKILRMEVKAIFTGLLRHYAGKPDDTFEVAEGAVVADLLREAGRRYGAKFPAGVWDVSSETFGDIVITGRRGGGVIDRGEALKPGDEVMIIAKLAGG